MTSNTAALTCPTEDNKLKKNNRTRLPARTVRMDLIDCHINNAVGKKIRELF